jgi:hypothetical protein
MFLDKLATGGGFRCQSFRVFVMPPLKLLTFGIAHFVFAALFL